MPGRCARVRACATLAALVWLLLSAVLLRPRLLLLLLLLVVLLLLLPLVLPHRVLPSLLVAGWASALLPRRGRGRGRP